MPIYDYECQSCQQPFEVEAKMSDPPPAACPHCHGNQLRRCISRTAFVLKGAGWYVTDYKSGNKDKGSSSVSGSSPSSSNSATPAAAPSTDSSTTSTPAKSDTTSTDKK